MKFEGMDIPSSRSSQESRLSTLSSALSSPHSPSLFSSFSSPRPLSSALSMRSEDSLVSVPGFDVQPHLDRLLPCVSAMLSRFDQVNQITDDVHNLEIKLEEVLARKRKQWINNENKGDKKFGESSKQKEVGGEGKKTDISCRKTNLFHPRPQVSLPSSFSFTPSTLHSCSASMSFFPRARSTYSESESVPFQPQGSEAAKLASGVCGLYPVDSPGFGQYPRRRAWHSGSSHSADAAQRILVTLDRVAACANSDERFVLTRPRSEEGVRRHIGDRVPVKRKAWISEGPETEQDKPSVLTLEVSSVDTVNPVLSGSL